MAPIMSEAQKKFYLTTPIYYVNARPHIGHAYTTIAADVIARRHRLLGDDTFFLTGTDEHGQKIERSAAAAGIPPQQFADQVSAQFESLWKRMGITNDDYIRTTEDRHKKGVQKLFQLLRDRDKIYLSTYTGQYSVGEEMFIDGPPGTIGPDGKPTETVTEENYFFRLSEYQEDLIKLIANDKLLIEPRTRRNEVLSFLCGNVKSVLDEYIAGNPPVLVSDEPGEDGIVPAGDSGLVIALKLAIEAGKLKKVPDVPEDIYYIPGALKDLSISRSSFKWGIPVPGDEKHVIYVWLDALANYMTAIGYGSDDPADQEKFKKYWPADLHLVGKEIIRFHCVYWPAFLLAAGLPLPKAITAHGWLLFEESKMSKSRGNIVRTETILDAFGTLCPPISSPFSLSSRSEAEGSASPEPPQTPTKAEQDLFAADVIRYFLLREIPFGQDGSFSFDALVQRYNSDLANGYGNLVSRTLTLIQKGLNSEFRKIHDGGFAFGIVDEGEDAIDKPFNWTLGVQGQVWWANEVWNKSPTLEEAVTAHFEKARFGLAVEAIWQAIRSVDGYLSENTPWKLIGSFGSELFETLDKVLYTAAESIRIITALLYPILPYATSKVWAQLGLGSIEQAAANGELKNLQWGGLKPGTKLGPLSPIFPRADKGLIQTMTDMEQNNAAPKPAEPAGLPHVNIEVDNPAHEHTEFRESPISSESATPSMNLIAETVHPIVDKSAAPDTPQIAIDDFVKIDLRVAKIIVAERIPKADKLLRLEVDLGYEKRQILSGIAQWYTPEELIGRNIVVIANLAPRKMRGLESHGMLLAASHGEDGKPVLATFGEDIALGSRLR
jgi:methionyl-tRNA synthetase